MEGTTESRRERTAAPLVSVIMIFLDAERFIEEAIASVFAQTWPHWELVLVDDGSTDQSTAIAKRYAAEHPERVRYFEHAGHANRGTGASRNLGIAHARGEYIAFLDADDIYLPERLEHHIEVLEQYDEVDAVQSAHLFWHSWVGSGDADEPAVHVLEGGCPIVAPPSLLGNLVGTLPFGPPQTGSLTVRVSALSTIGAFEESFHSLYEDQVWFAKLYTHANIYLLAEILVYYRQHAQSLCATMLRAGVWDWCRPNAYTRAFFAWLDDYLAAYNLRDETVRCAVAARLRPYRHPLIWRLQHTCILLLRVPPIFVRILLRVPPIFARILAGRLLPKAVFERLRHLRRRRAEVSRRAEAYRLEGLYGPLHIRMPSDDSQHP